MTNFQPCKQLFDLPDNIIYMDGNSLGPLPKGAAARAEDLLQDQWGKMLIRAWNKADWMEMPKLVGDRIAPLIGASKGSVVTGETLSIKLYQALDAALKLRPDRKLILSDTGNFPTDLYMAKGLINTIDKGYELKLVSHEAIIEALDENVAALMLTHVDYRTGRMFDMEKITKCAHQAGAVMIWDLAHSAGAMALDLASCRAEFAIGCTYKFLNGGPGAPAFIYVRPDLITSIEPGLAGWLGHEAPFAMEVAYRPAADIERMRIGTPSIIQLAILDEALNVFDTIDLEELRAASIQLSQTFIELVEGSCPQLKLASPRNPDERGSQVSFHFSQAYAAMQALIERGIIGDFRTPDIMRFGITPLYLEQNDVERAAATLAKVMENESWRDKKYQTRGRVT